MYLAGRWAHRQLSRLELVVVTIVLGLILTVLLQHMLKLFAVAERSLLETTVTNVNTTLKYRAAVHMLKGDFAGLQALKGVNPFLLLSARRADVVKAGSEELYEEMGGGLPVNFLGELKGADPAAVPGGSWYYEQTTDRLVYRVDNAEYFFSSLPGAPRVEFTVEFDYEDKNGDGRFDPAIDEYRDIRLKAGSNYEWRL